VGSKYERALDEKAAAWVHMMRGLVVISFVASRLEVSHRRQSDSSPAVAVVFLIGNLVTEIRREA
jgi:hypothetical protein